MRRLYYILIFCLGISSLPKAQSLFFRNYNSEDGLSQSQVLSIHQDEKGYIWFGTNGGGISKFDGSHFKGIGTSEGLSNNVVFSICGDEKGKLFIGTGNGFSIYNGWSFRNITEIGGQKIGTVYKTLYTEEEVWIGTDKGAFTYKNGKVEAFKGDEVLDNSSVYTIFKDRKGDVWFGTTQNGVVKYHSKDKQFYHYTTRQGLTNDFVFSLEENETDIIVGTQTGLNYIDPNGNIRESTEVGGGKNMSFTSIERDSYGNYYFGTFYEGVAIVNYEKKYLGSFDSKKGIGDHPILCIKRDREGNLWIGTNGSGVYRYSGKKFTYYTKLNGLPDKYVNAVTEDKEGNIWVAVTDNGVVKISGKNTEVFKADYKTGKGVCDNNVKAMITGSDGKIYFGTEDGFCYCDKGEFVTPTDEKIRHKYILSLYQDQKGMIWIGTTDGAYVFSDGKISAAEAVNKFASPGIEMTVYSISGDKNGNTYFGIETGIIQMNEKDSKFFNDKNGFSSVRVGANTTDAKGNVWIGTEKGLFFYDGKTFKGVGKEYGIAESFINLICIDADGNVIVGGNNGLDIINTEAFYKGEIKVKHLRKEDGLLSRESNANACIIDNKKRALIGTINGLEMYDASEDHPNLLEPVTLVSGIKLSLGNDDIYNYSEGMDSLKHLPIKTVLPYQKNNLTFSFIGVSLTSPEKVRYSYRLQGIEENWSPETNITDITYPSLPPGSYTFYVKAMNNDGVWNKEPAGFSFVIQPPWYKTWWFYTFSFLIIISGIVLYNNYRTKKLKADNLKLEIKVEERTKEVVKQKQEIEHKNVEITDSIKYAKNIQEALLPSLAEVEKAFDDCFVLYLPKDIVSGDFFWFHENEKYKYIAAADCTGHGVPGAFMSIVGNTLLNEIVEQGGAMLPGDILLELHKGVKNALSSSEKESQRRDGMDISLVAISKKENKLEYAGANRPLWIYKNEKSLEIIKATKSPIGGLELEDERKYVNHTIEVSKGDSIYIFSDGFADQFGGPNGKKLMVANMQKVITENLSLTFTQQKQKIRKTFEDWKAEHEQVDDVLVIGVRI
jgi:ligand-binding sensor domain-containing protein/serine phosphatase RsbU (regulator of sigma subunit)